MLKYKLKVLNQIKEDVIIISNMYLRYETVQINVLGRICNELKCNIEDIVDYKDDGSRSVNNEGKGS